jgi:septin family protein
MPSAHPQTPAPQIGLPNLPNQRYRLMTKRGCSYNLMLVGQSGLGKTTFINTLFGGETLREWKEDTVRGRESEVGIFVVQALVKLAFSIQHGK